MYYWQAIVLVSVLTEVFQGSFTKAITIRGLYYLKVWKSWNHRTETSNWHTSLNTTKRTHKLMCMNNTLKYKHIAFYFSRNYGCTLDTELNRLSFSSYFDKSHLELWRKKQVLIQGAPNLSHCLKSWKKIFDQGGYSIPFSPSIRRIKPVFFSSKKWVMTAVRQMRFVTEILSLSFSPFFSTGFIFNMNRHSGTRLLTQRYVHSVVQMYKKSHTWNSIKAITSYYRALHESMG